MQDALCNGKSTLHRSKSALQFLHSSSDITDVYVCLSKLGSAHNSTSVFPGFVSDINLGRQQLTWFNSILMFLATFGDIFATLHWIEK